MKEHQSRVSSIHRTGSCNILWLLEHNTVANKDHIHYYIRRKDFRRYLHIPTVEMTHHTEASSTFSTILAQQQHVPTEHRVPLRKPTSPTTIPTRRLSRLFSHIRKQVSGEYASTRRTMKEMLTPGFMPCHMPLCCGGGAVFAKIIEVANRSARRVLEIFIVNNLNCCKSARGMFSDPFSSL